MTLLGNVMNVREGVSHHFAIGLLYYGFTIYFFCQQAVCSCGYHVANLEELVKVEWDENERDAVLVVLGRYCTLLMHD